MFEVGNYVVYGNTGICKIEEIKLMDLMGSGTEKQYYVLAPISDKSGKAFLPVDNTKVVLRAVITEEEAQNFVANIPGAEIIEVANDKLREETYKSLARTCDCQNWILILKTIYLRKKERFAQGKKSTATDERYYRMAADSLFEELGFAMGLDRKELESRVNAQLEKL